MSTQIIQKRIYLEPKYLTANIYEHIIDKLTQSVQDCTKEYGHVLDINKIISYTNVENTVFNVIFEATVFKPDTGDNVTGKICMIFKDGIFINILDKQKMLITSKILMEKGYTYDECNNTFVGKKDSLVMGKEINAVILATKYINKKYNCYGKLTS